MEIVASVIFFLLGVSVGSFLNVVADRVPLGRSIVSPPSHCFSCQRELQARDLVPVISYIVLRGRCRYCGAKIPLRSMLVELITGLVFALAFLRFGSVWRLAAAVVYGSIFILLSIVDLEKREIPAVIILPCSALSLIVVACNTFTFSPPDIIIAAIGMATGGGLFLLAWGLSRLFRKSVIRWTDILLACLVGLAVGFPLIGVAILLAALAGGLVASALRLFKSIRLTGPMPFALYLGFGALVTIFFSDELLNLLASI